MAGVLEERYGNFLNSTS